MYSNKFKINQQNKETPHIIPKITDLFCDISSN